jgi:hypothetical protein
MEVSPQFVDSLASLDLSGLDREQGTVYAVNAQLDLVYFNSAWARFASANGGEAIAGRWGLGSNVLEACGAPLRPFYEQLFGEALQRGLPLEHTYECSSPEQYRKMHMRVLPLGGRGLLIANTCIEERARLVAGSAPAVGAYRRGADLMVQCAHCRRTRRADVEERWDWVPLFVARPPPYTSHGLCPVCLEYYYPAGAPPEAQPQG